MDQGVSSIADWAQVATGVASILIAIFAWRVSVEAIFSSYTPILRPVAVIVKATRMLDPAQFMVKNIGNGPAIGIQVFEHPTPPNAQPVGTLDVLAAAASAGFPRALLSMNSTVDFDPKDGTTYRILYQDQGGNWHESHATYGRDRIYATYLGRYRWWHWFWQDRRIPRQARIAAHVVTDV